jgi:hypothetical protein
MSDTWPKYIRVRYSADPDGPGVQIKIFEPLNPDYEPSQTMWMFGNQTGTFVSDPSNGASCTPPQPLRSPAGFPLFYARGAGNAPVGKPRVFFGETTYVDDADVLAWIKSRPGYEASLLAPKEVWTAASTVLSTTNPNAPKEPSAADVAAYQALTGDREKADFLSQHYDLISRVQREWPAGGQTFAQWIGHATFAPYQS